MYDTAWAPYFWLGCLVTLLLLARRYAGLVPRAQPRLIAIDERHLLRDVPPQAAAAARALNDLGFVSLGWMQRGRREGNLENPSILILRHPSATIAAVAVTGDHDPPVRVHLSTRLQDGWSVETWDGGLGRDLGTGDKVRRYESWALTLPGLYRDHLRSVARQGAPVDPAETTVQSLVAQDLACADEDWRRFLAAGWLRETARGVWRPNFLRVLVHVPQFAWSDLVHQVLGVLRGRRWTGDVPRRRPLPRDRTLFGWVDSHGVSFGLVALALALAVFVLPQVNQRGRRGGPEPALDDGPPPRRSASDPLLASPAPLYGPLLPPAGAAQLRALVPFEGGLLGVERIGPRNSALLWWPDPRQPPARVASIDGVARVLVPSPAGGRCVLLVGASDQMRPDENQSVSLLERDDWRYRTLTRGPWLPFVAPVWNPSGDQLAVATGTMTPTELKMVTRVYQLPAGHVVASADSISAVPSEWSNGEWLLRGPGAIPSASDPFAHYRWRTDSAPRRVPSTELAAESPGGRFRVRRRGGTVTIEESGATRTLPFPGRENESILELLRRGGWRWLSTDRLVFARPDPIALDLTTGKLQYLFAESVIELVAASSDGRWVTAQDDAGRFLWATQR